VQSSNDPLDNATAASTIRAWRRYRGLSQVEFASQAGIHRAQISAWESGRHSPTHASLEKLASFFDVDVVRFLAGPTAPVTPMVSNREDLIEVALYDGISPFLRGEPTGSMLIPAFLKGCIAARLTGQYPGWRRMRPEVRLGDVWAVQPGGTPKDGSLVAAVQKAATPDQGDGPIGGIYRPTLRLLESSDPSFPSLNLDDYDVVAVAQALLWRDYRDGVRR